MATERRHRFGAADVGLFGRSQVPDSTDSRRVGEMLVDVDTSTRELLLDVVPQDAAALLRAWPPLLSAASRLWDALPVPSNGDWAEVRERRELPMQQLVALSATMNAKLNRSAWPGPGRTDPRLGEATRTLNRAAALVERYGSETRLERASTHRDIEAARTRTMHSLYVTAHAIGVALHQARRRESPPPVVGWIQHLAGSEKAAGRYLGSGHYVGALEGEVRRGSSDPDRLATALATWDVVAHRTLAAEPTPNNLWLVTKGQGFIAGAALTLLQAGDAAGAEPDERLQRLVGQAGRAWDALSARLADLRPHAPLLTLNPKLMAAAGQVRAACRELTHDKTTLASLAQVAEHPALRRATTHLRGSLDTGAELAGVVGEVVADVVTRPELRAPAVALAHRAQEEDPETEAAWVSPQATLTNALIPIPQPVIQGLHAAGQRLVDATAAAGSAAQAGTVAQHHRGAASHPSIKQAGEIPFVPATNRRGIAR